MTLHMSGRIFLIVSQGYTHIHTLVCSILVPPSFPPFCNTHLGTNGFMICDPTVETSFFYLNIYSVANVCVKKYHSNWWNVVLISNWYLQKLTIIFTLLNLSCNLVVFHTNSDIDITKFYAVFMHYHVTDFLYRV